MNREQSQVRAIGVRWVFTGISPPLRDGYVIAVGDTIHAVSRHRPDLPVRDYFDCALLPGLINSHTHLEFSHYRQPIGQAGQSFVTWLQQVIVQRRTERTMTNESEHMVRWLAGYEEAARYGTRWLADVTTTTAFRRLERKPVTGNLGVRCRIFAELLGLARHHWPRLWTTATEHVRWSGWSEMLGPGWSPHAPYTVALEFLAPLVQLAAERHIPLAMHLAESAEECELVRTGTGPLRDLLESFDAWDPSSFGTRRSFLDYLQLLAQASQAVIIHGNYLDAAERQFLADHRDRMSVVFCPRTHAYFAHPNYPLVDLIRRGVRVVLGTDSRASNPDLSVYEEMRFVAARYPQTDPADVVKMATVWAAEAMGCHDQFGSIVPGKKASLTLVRLQEPQRTSPFESLWHGAVCADDPWFAGGDEPESLSPPTNNGVTR